MGPLRNSGAGDTVESEGSRNWSRKHVTRGTLGTNLCEHEHFDSSVAQRTDHRSFNIPEIYQNVCEETGLAQLRHLAHAKNQLNMKSIDYSSKEQSKK